jgi:hypothetical protein
MHVTLRRKGLTLNAVWDGVAKPSSKLINHWLRAKPDLAQVNTTFKPSNVVGIFVPAIHSQHSVTSSIMGGATLGLSMGAWGTYAVTTEITSIFTTQVDYSTSPWVVLNSYSIAQAENNTVNALGTNSPALLFEDFGIADLPSLVAESYANNYLTMQPNYGTTDFNCEIPVSTLNFLAYTQSVELVEQSTGVILSPSNNVVLLDAPLPNHSLFNQFDPTVNDTLAASPVRHMQSIITDLDENRDGYLVKAPRPTHFVLGSQIPVHSPNTVRRNAPEIFVRSSGVGLVTGSSTSMGSSLVKRISVLTAEQSQRLYERILYQGGTQDVKTTQGLNVSYNYGSNGGQIEVYFKEMVDVSGIDFRCSSNSGYIPDYVYLFDHIGDRGQSRCYTGNNSRSFGAARKTNYLRIRFTGTNRYRANPHIYAIFPRINY